MTHRIGTVDLGYAGNVQSILAAASNHDIGDGLGWSEKVTIVLDTSGYNGISITFSSTQAKMLALLLQEAARRAEQHP